MTLALKYPRGALFRTLRIRHPGLTRRKFEEPVPAKQPNTARRRNHGIATNPVELVRWGISSNYKLLLAR